MRQWKSELFLGSKLSYLCIYPPEKKRKEKKNRRVVNNSRRYNHSRREFCQMVRKIVIHSIGDRGHMEACPCLGQDGKRDY